MSRSPEETAVMAGVFAGLVPDNTVLALSGGLGAGKTAFVRGMAVAFGVNAPVSSPSYAIFNLHEGRRIQLAHVDAYRLVEPEEFDALALWELLEEPWVLVVEWPENLGNRLPAETWWMDCAIEGQDVRRFRLRGT
ncbi:MAG: tRNA (adenosine(37)-N6)-threonylcarbamoyltransferase complex ATPase subunit type 1 TsaE [Puniceicoccales bacterium]|nr:tRNA (adenosine(37)-N6)-threonylcarbamoyltransferase complex ATPase subunit type 1 TsaE [Puniceicoccales bacterium]